MIRKPFAGRKRDILRRRVLLLVTLLVSIAAVGGVTPARISAQETGRIEGTVRRVVTEESVDGASVTVLGTKLRTSTDEQGRFELSGVPVGEVHLRVERSGYASLVQGVIVTPNATATAEIEMISLEDAIQGLAISGNVQREPEPSPEPGLYYPDPRPGDRLTDVLDRIPGVEVIRGGAQLGVGTRLRVRGTKSMTLPGDPLLFVDGVQIMYTEREPAQRGVSTGMTLDVIDPMHIRSIEVLHGPAAAGRYGLGAVNGVIVITTKRGG
jgi:TonB-dependent SusC/RagA subfamily outer membrane receptor